MLKHQLLAGCLIVLTILPFKPHIFQEQIPPLEVSLIVEDTQLKTSQKTHVTLILDNPTPYRLTGLNVNLINRNFDIYDSTEIPNSLEPYETIQLVYTLLSNESGLRNVVFSIGYNWATSPSITPQHTTEVVQSREIEVINPLAFEWPKYLFPLLVGFIIGQLGNWLNDKRKLISEENNKIKQAHGITLAMLRQARRSLERVQDVSFSLWEEAIVKGHLYPSIAKLENKLGQVNISRNLAKFAADIDEYNHRLSQETLDEDFLIDIRKELDDLIKSFEN